MEIITTTPELAAITRELVGSLASVTSIAKPEANYHQIDAKPSDVIRVTRADIFVRIGMDMDMWADALVGAARNSKVARGASGYVDASARIKKLEVPTSGINGASGDVHAMGNPHYWFDPKDAVVVAYQILLAVRSVDKANAATYDANYKRFSDEITTRLVGWEKTLAPFKGHGFVAYHDEWIYFATRFGLTPFGFLEPKPGIPPSGGHVADLIQKMKANKVRAVIMGSIYSTKYADLIAKEAGGKVSVVPYSVGGMGTRNYFDYINAIVEGFAKALR